MTHVRALVPALLLLASAGAAADLPTVTHEGRAYVELDRIAASLQGALDAQADSARAQLRTDGHVVTVTRNWKQVLVDGKPEVLDAPVRVRDGAWLVPESFLKQVLPKLGGAAAQSRIKGSAGGSAGRDGFRFHSHLTYTRVVVETPAAPEYMVETQSRTEVRVRLVSVNGPARTRKIRDGLVGEVRVEPAGGDSVLVATFEGTPGETRVLTLRDPHRLVLDFMRATRAPAITLTDVRLRSYPSYSRVVLETSAPVSHRIETQDKGEVRVRLTALASAPRVEKVGDGLIDEVRLESAAGDVILRVAFAAAPGETRVTALSDPDRLVLDFLKPATEEPRDRREVAAPLRVIVLDAGHGGHDSGAVGPTGLMEKELVLDITRRVAKLLEERLDVKVLLTRDGDQFIALRDRTSIANRERADLFVSIHANAHRETASAGVETYFLSSEATDSGARQVAALENGVVQLEKPAARGRADAVKTILWDLAQSEFQIESSHLAEIVLDSMTSALRISNRGVKQAGFYVLGGAAMPAILVEIGFVTNPREERRLRDAKYRDEIARAIFAGLAEYKRNWDHRMRTALGPGR
ncbi:MAG: N-acetylmuramoyl-L-alanine amidase [Candidatus Rokubacteria bacterium]|nr:N-acetylmuramoyl-L-alanine amidase [Candidatus Rokubacteria bacterium]